MITVNTPEVVREIQQARASLQDHDVLSNIGKLVMRLCPFCGHVRDHREHKSWCEEHDECLCPKCGTCPKADVGRVAHG